MPSTRGGKLWATRNVACNLGGGDAESCIDWAQIDVSGPAPVLEQQQIGGAFGSTDDYRYYPDISVDRNGNIAIGYTKSSPTTYTQVWVAGARVQRPARDAAGRGPAARRHGQLRGRPRVRAKLRPLGDYTGLTVDPDGCTFWYLASSRTEVRGTGRRTSVASDSARAARKRWSR